ncbi:class I SAM-dependent methyltransferase [Gryllotalpicola ginsengisoli]|uniref:class I SAM-dependent methyltransferase n=1 Tax=Gryllotalpicola ginsengisoli TaxID=444608 RepID=UPI0003B46F54|nr:class I SAM-dependent methyltransferase [Gryllotalpicola ginsengisoli]
MSDERMAGIIARFDERAADYDDSAMHRALAEAVAGFADFDQVGTVLDVGTGTGLVLRAIAARHPSLRLVGVDVTPGMLAVARRELPAAEFIEGRAEELPVADAAADLVTCVTVLHLVADPAAVFDEFARMLAPEGTLVTATFAVRPEHGHGAGAATPGYTPNHAPFQTPEALAEVAAPAGFVLARHETVDVGDDRVLIAELAPVD